jgi:hypothetical protein
MLQALCPIHQPTHTSVTFGSSRDREGGERGFGLVHTVPCLSLCGIGVPALDIQGTAVRALAPSSQKRVTLPRPTRATLGRTGWCRCANSVVAWMMPYAGSRTHPRMPRRQSRHADGWAAAGSVGQSAKAVAAGAGVQLNTREEVRADGMGMKGLDPENGLSCFCVLHFEQTRKYRRIAGAIAVRGDLDVRVKVTTLSDLLGTGH